MAAVLTTRGASLGLLVGIALYYILVDKNITKVGD